MTRLIAVLSVLIAAAATAVDAAQLRQELGWEALRAAGRLAGGVLRPADAGASFPHLRVENATAQPVRVTVLTLDRPPISRPRYALTGTVRHESVEGAGFLELWSVFPDGGRYFSRTLAESGPLGRLTGSSDWRPFVLPFQNREGAPPPVELVLNVVLPGQGRVDLGPLRLVDFEAGEDPVAGIAGAWWGDQTAAWTGAIGGSTLGLLGALIGVLGGMGRARRLVLGLTGALIGGGVLALLAAAAAVGLGQPYAVYYPLLLLGLLAAVLGAVLLAVLRRSYAARELRRMRAADLR